MRDSTRHRRQRILAELHERQDLAASSLARELDVSEATVRRDLHALAAAGEAELVHGGAVVPRASDFSFRSKARRHVEAKRQVGRLAAELVADGEQIFLDSGTTCFEMAGYLKKKRDVSVIANSARLAMELDSPHLQVILLGGQYRPGRMDTVGPLAMAALRELRGYRAFIGADGLSAEFGLTASDIDSAHLFRLAAANAREVVLLVDHSKFLSPSLCRIVGWEGISTIVTDRPPDDPWGEFLRERRIEVVTPPADQAQDQGGIQHP